nr:MAG TPA: major capsid protein [Caudoviricetes sp.]
MPDIDNVRPGPGNSDFQGWASKNNLLCTDGRVIRENAFAHQNGAVVPLIWNHRHDTPSAVIGKATLVNKPDGVYCYGLFNNTKFGNMCKELVAHGDVTSLSILANQLKQKGHDVMHGMIREVSLVLAGANPQAFIEDMDLAHGEDAEYEARIYPQEPIICHGDEDFEEQEPENTPAEENPEGNPTNESEPESNPESDPTPANQNGEENPVENNNPTANPELQHADGSEETIQDVIDSMNEKQKNVMYYLVATARDENKEDPTMAHNAFEGGANTTAQLTRENFALLAKEAKACSSLKEAVLAHMDDMEGLSDALAHADYGIENIEYLFPDDRNVTRQPQFIQRDMSWVSGVMQGVHHVPFSRIKSIFADITADEARAKGYLKGKLKKEEVFTLLKRSTTPQTIYKKQKLDRDDIIDIVDFDVVAWLKSEMRMMLNEEIARAILVSDGRSTASDDKIKEDNIRPIWTDADLYTIKVGIDSVTYNDDDKLAKEFIRQCIKSRKDYKGSGNPALYTTEEMLTNMLLLEDGIGHRLYKTEEELRTALRVSKIVTVPVMEGLTREVTHETDSKAYIHSLMGIIVNLTDYTVGADKGGAVAMFDDFDIDYNQQKYLMETRCSGALTQPYSAITIESYAVKAGG